MENFNSFYDFILGHLKTFFYPEEWLDLDLNFSKMELLSLLMVERRGEISMSEMAEAMNMPMSTATGIADRMVRKGLLKRERTETDRRMVVLGLSEQGREVIAHWKEVVSRYLNQIEEALTDEEKKLLFKVFIKVISILKQKSEKSEVPESVPTVRQIEIE